MNDDLKDFRGSEWPPGYRARLANLERENRQLLERGQRMTASGAQLVKERDGWRDCARKLAVALRAPQLEAGAMNFGLRRTDEALAEFEAWNNKKP